MNNSVGNNSMQSSISAPNASVPNIATMHGDTSCSDTTPYSGPAFDFQISYHHLLTTCSTILIRSDGNPMILGTTFVPALKELFGIVEEGETESSNGSISPVVMVLDKDTGNLLSKRPLRIPGGNLLGGVYAYLDGEDRLWMVDGNNWIIYIEADTSWRLTRTLYADLNSYLTNGDGVISLSPDTDGDIWFVSAYGVFGICNCNTRKSEVVNLNKFVYSGETVNNSFPTANTASGLSIAAVATNYGLYLYSKDTESCSPIYEWSLSYDRGTSLKPGQLGYPIPGDKINRGYGTGATPTFFGPTTGAEYVTITNNSDENFSVLIADISTGQWVSQQAIFPPGSQGTENSAIALNETVIVASTYGYPYPVPPFFNPCTYPFKGGLVRVDLNKGVVWQNMKIRSAAVPKLSLADGLIYTITRHGESMVALPEDSYCITAIDFSTGHIVSEQEISCYSLLHHHPLYTLLYSLHNPLQMAGNFSVDGTFWQGTMGGVFRISKKS